jgi:hypothetical protein
VTMPDASLVFEDPDPHAPGTHVLSIGVSAYDHLLGGKEERPELADGMGQLRSPSASARSVADWFLSEFTNTDAPLRALSMLLSEPVPEAYSNPRTGIGVVLPDATMLNVERAVDHWLDRASTNVDDMIVFFFAGHGISSGADPLLFLQDFGRRPRDKFSASINLNDFLEGMRTQEPGKQLFLIDACRTSERTSVELAGLHKGVGLVSATDVSGTGRSLALQSVHHAATQYAPAYGVKDDVSLFTEALIRALRGGGAQPQSGWNIGTSGLEQALGAYVERAARKHSVIQIPERSRSQYFVINTPASVTIPLYVSLDKAEAWGDLHQLDVSCALGISAQWTSGPQQPILEQEWSCVVPHREHTVAASFRQGTAFSHSPENCMVGPPETTFELKIQLEARS